MSIDPESLRMIDDTNSCGCHADPASMTAPLSGLHLFADGCYDPRSGEGGWAFVAYRDAIEVASDCGGLRNSANNAMEVVALLQAARWVNSNAAAEAAVIWSDSNHAVHGFNSWLPIWRHNGWKKIDPNPRARRRTIADAELWKAIDRQLSQNQLVTVAWLKGHAGIDGNERADALAEKGRLSIRSGAGMREQASRQQTT